MPEGELPKLRVVQLASKLLCVKAVGIGIPAY